jgi:predicted nucleotidyltransferase
MEVLRVHESLMVVPCHNIGQVLFHIRVARDNRHHGKALIAGGAEGPETLNIRDCHNRTMVANAINSQHAIDSAVQDRRIDPPNVAGENRDMVREEVLAALRAHERELKAAGIVRLSLFGSTARGDASPDSDIDLLAAFDSRRRLSTLDVVAIQLRISGLLGRPVDLSEEGTLKPRVQLRVDPEAIRAF